jgi:RNA polymerase sigma-70 factor (ECF subfamily)
MGASLSANFGMGMRPKVRLNSKAMTNNSAGSESAMQAQKLREFEEQTLPLMPFLLAMARRMVNIEEDAQDLVQETYMKAWRSWKQFEQGTNLKAWMMTIMRNTSKNNFEKSNKDKAKSSIDSLEDWQVGTAESLTSRTSRSAEAEALDNIPAQTVLKALDGLPEDFREVLLQAVVVGRSYKEIAEELGVNPITVGTRLSRAKEALRVTLADYAREEGYSVPEDKE